MVNDNTLKIKRKDKAIGQPPDPAKSRYLPPNFENHPVYLFFRLLSIKVRNNILPGLFIRKNL